MGITITKEGERTAIISEGESVSRVLDEAGHEVADQLLRAFEKERETLGPGIIVTVVPSLGAGERTKVAFFTCTNNGKAHLSVHQRWVTNGVIDDPEGFETYARKVGSKKEPEETIPAYPYSQTLAVNFGYGRGGAQLPTLPLARPSLEVTRENHCWVVSFVQDTLRLTRHLTEVRDRLTEEGTEIRVINIQP